MVYWVTGAILLVYLLLVWFLGAWINPPGSGIWVLRIGLWLIGILGASFTVWWFHRQAKASEAEGAPISPGVTSEVDLLVRDAVRKLKGSAMSRGATLRNLPLIFLLGEPGSAKTTTILHSGLDPELLAGHVYQDNIVAPTRVANFWYTRQAVFVDGGGGLFAQPELWRRLIRLVQPGRVAAAGRRQQAPRAAIVTLDCEFLRPGGQEAALSVARRLGTRLLEISQTLGIRFPIYVLFTKADRIGARSDGGSAFLDYVAGLGKDETSQVLGATLPVRSLQVTGVYAEEETRRLENAFDELFYSLAEKRVDFLSIAGQADKLAGIYEFPRELRKLRKYAVPFLVELARPSQLSVNPFLRGFYFAGIRPLIVEGAVASMPEPEASDQSFSPNATVIFGAKGTGAAPSVAPPRLSATRKIPEWLFLSQFFNEVLLKDRVALSASGFSSRVSLLRRVVFASVVGIALVFAIGFSTSFLGNLFLEQRVNQAAHDVIALRPVLGQAPSVDQLQKLDGLRQQLETLSTYRRKGVPWHLRWWMYSGDDLYPAARRIYFEQFGNLLFAETQGRLLNALRNVKERPDLNDSYEATYNTLKAYLITTAHPEKSSKDFLPPILYNTWASGKTGDEQTAALARTQFEFYTGELLVSNPYPSTTDQLAVDRARSYLRNFGGIDRYYLPLKADVSRKIPIASFNRQFRDAGDVVLCSHDVEGAFTPEGFTRMQDAIAHNRIVSEDWVLGRLVASQLDQATLQQQLTDRYHSDFIKEWRTVLQLSAVHNYANFHDSDVKLARLISPSSPLLELFWFVSHNTNVQSQQVIDSFQPVQSVVPPGPADQYILPSNQSYVQALTKLKAQIDLLANSPTGAGDTNLVTQALAAVGDTNGAITQLAQRFHVDPQFHIESVTQSLLAQPADHAQALIRMGPKEALNGGGRKFCTQFGQMADRFPFNPSSSQDVPVDQLNAILAPGTGELWKFYSTTLAQYFTKSGSRYVATPAGSVRISPEFETFFNRVAMLSDALYPNGSPLPRMTYSLKQGSTNIEGLALKIGNETLSGTGQKSFTWTGAPEEIEVTAKDFFVASWAAGPWSVFRFINEGHPQTRAPSVAELTYTVKQSNGQDVLKNGQKEFYTFDLQLGTSNLLRLSDFSGLRCVAQIAR
jgi:type VI secretion system protein ImpL